MSALLGLVLMRSILVSSVLVSMWMTYHGQYVIAAVLGLSLLCYAYLTFWGGEPVEERLGGI